MAQLHPQTMKFLQQIKKNNNKPWFDKNKSSYEEIRSAAIEIAGDLIKEVQAFDASIGSPDPKKSVMRIYRDIRFSKDKTPYKTNIGIGLGHGSDIHSAGYYIHIQPGNSFIGGGMWMPEPKDLQKIRQEIDYNFKDFKAIVEAPAFKKTFGKLDSEEKLIRAPKPYSEDNPAIDYLKLKSLTCGTKLGDEDVLSKNFVKKVAQIFKTMQPFIRFLNEAIK